MSKTRNPVEAWLQYREPVKQEEWTRPPNHIWDVRHPLRYRWAQDRTQPEDSVDPGRNLGSVWSKGVQPWTVVSGTDQWLSWSTSMWLCGRAWTRKTTAIVRWKSWVEAHALVPSHESLSKRWALSFLIPREPVPRSWESDVVTSVV